MASQLYDEHARLLRQMARHIELSNTFEHRLAHGDPAPLTTNDQPLAATFFDSSFSFPAGRNLVQKMVLGMLPDQDRSFKLLDMVSVSVSTSGFDETVTFSFIAMPGRELQTAKLFKDAADYAQRRADSHTRVIAPPTRAIAQMER